MRPVCCVSKVKEDGMRIPCRGRKVWAFLFLIVTSNATLVFSQPPNIYTFNPDVKVTDAVPGDGTSSIFFSSGQHFTAFRGDTVYVVWWESRISNPPTGNHVFLGKSTDGGATFGPSVRVNDIPAGFDPSMRMDSNGVIYVAYDRQGDIWFTKSTDGGNTFTPSINVVDVVGQSANQQDPSIAVNNEGHVFIAWRDSRTGNSTVFAAASYDGGQTFEQNVQVGNENNGENYDIAADENGRVYVAYGDDLGGGYGIVVARSTDTGNTFTLFTQIGHGIDIYPSLGIQKDGRVGVAFERQEDYGQIRFSFSSDFGQTFSPSARVDTGYNEMDCIGGFRHSVAVSNGLFYVAWGDGRIQSSDSNCIGDAFLSYSPDGGCSFVTEVGRDTNSIYFNYADPHRPSLAVNEVGKVFVAWIDGRLDPVQQIYQYIFGASANPHFIKGDLNLDAVLTPADVVLELNAVFLGKSFPASPETADVNCDTQLTPADVVLHLNATFNGEPFPCS